MKTGLHQDILKKIRLLMEQDPGGLPPLPPPGAGGDVPPMPPPSGGGGGGKKEDKKDDAVEAGQPIVDSENPIDAVYDYGYEVAKDTVDPQVITNAFKSAIQANFGSNVEDAWPVVERLKNTENQIMIDVAQRLSLFISGSIQEHRKRGSLMKVSKQEIRQYVKEAFLKNRKSVKEINVTPLQLESIIQGTVKRILKEGALFDTYRSEIDKEQSQIEQQLTSADIRRMAIDLFEKICDKTGVDSDSLTPEAMQFVKSELDRMVTSAQEIANKLIQVAQVVKTAKGNTPSSPSSEEEG